MIKRFKAFSSEQYNGDWPQENFKEFIDWCHEVLDTIPDANKDSARIEIEACESYGSPYATVEITYRREETKDEEAARVKDQRDREDYYENKERETLEALKRKYPDLVEDLDNE